MIRRGYTARDHNLLIRAYVAYVRPFGRIRQLYLVNSLLLGRRIIRKKGFTKSLFVLRIFFTRIGFQN